MPGTREPSAGGRGDLILGISGASGARLGLRALALFSASPDLTHLHVVVSSRALLVARTEISAGITSDEALLDSAGLDGASRAKLVLHAESAVDAPISSGSFQTRGMAVLPCSAGTLAAIAHGTSRGLLQRAADVCLKERRRLVLGLRETPLSLVHAENIERVTLAPTKVFKFPEKHGTLETGVNADVTVIDLQEGNFELIDQQNNKRTAKRKVVPVAVVHGGTLTKIDPAVHEGMYAGVKL